MKHGEQTERSIRITVAVPEAEHRALLERVAARTREEQRPVALAEAVREALKRGLEPERGHAA
jgi:hypothetical protein